MSESKMKTLFEDDFICVKLEERTGGIFVTNKASEGPKMAPLNIEVDGIKGCDVDDFNAGWKLCVLYGGRGGVMLRASKKASKNENSFQR